MTPDQTPFQDVILWIVAISTMMSFCATIWTIFSGPSRRNSGRIDEVSHRVDDLTMRVSTVETRQSQMPDSNDMHKVELAMEQIRGEMGKMTEAMAGQKDIMIRLEAIVTRHDDHLRKS